MRRICVFALLTVIILVTWGCSGTAEKLPENLPTIIRIDTRFCFPLEFGQACRYENEFRSSLDTYLSTSDTTWGIKGVIFEEAYNLPFDNLTYGIYCGEETPEFIRIAEEDVDDVHRRVPVGSVVKFRQEGNGRIGGKDIVVTTRSIDSTYTQYIKADTTFSSM